MADEPSPFPTPTPTTTTDAASPKPWAMGVSDRDQAAALKLFEEGNASFATRSYAAALHSYKRAIEFWDHPAIRFNISECHIHLDQPVKAYQNLEIALKFGAAPLESAIYERALTNQKLLTGQIAYVEVINNEVGAKVTLDGELLLSSPGRVEQILRPGRHQLVARRQGKMTQTEELRLLAGERFRVEVRLVDIGHITLVRRWSPWKPWSVVGGGAAIGVSGIFLQFRARSNRDRFDRYIANECPAGCTEQDLPSNIVSTRDSFELQSKVSIALLGIGTAVLAAGTVMVFLNQPREAASGSTNPKGRVTMIPYIGRRQAGFQLMLRY